MATSTSTLRIIIDSKAKGAGPKKTSDGLDKIVKAAGFAAAAFAALKGAQAAVDFAKFGAGVQRQTRALEGLAQSAGTSGDAIVSAIQESSSFTIDRMAAMEAATKAMLLDVAETPEAFERLTNVATQLGRAMGQDATKSIDDFVTAAGRQSKQIADNLGLMVSSADANQRFASTMGIAIDSMTDAQKKQAFLNEMLRQGELKLEDMGEQTLGAAGSFEQLSAAAADLKSGLAEIVAEDIEATVATDALAASIRNLPDAFREWRVEQQKSMSSTRKTNEEVKRLQETEKNRRANADAMRKTQALVNGVMEKGINPAQEMAQAMEMVAKAEDKVQFAAIDLRRKTELLAATVGDNSVEAFNAYQKAMELTVQSNEDAAFAIVKQRQEMERQALAAQQMSTFMLDTGMTFKQQFDSMAVSAADFASRREQIESEHQAKIIELTASGQLELIGQENVSHQERIENLIEAQRIQEEQQQQSLGRMILQSFEAWATMKGIPADKMLEMRTAIAQEFGLIDEDTANKLGVMVQGWETWAAGVGTNVANANATMRTIKAEIDAIPSVKEVTIRVRREVQELAKELGPGFVQPNLQSGTRNFKGGFAMVGEAGPELVELPSGTKVFTAAETSKILRNAQGFQLGAGKRTVLPFEERKRRQDRLDAFLKEQEKGITDRPLPTLPTRPGQRRRSFEAEKLSELMAFLRNQGGGDRAATDGVTLGGLGGGGFSGGGNTIIVIQAPFMDARAIANEVAKQLRLTGQRRVPPISG